MNSNRFFELVGLNRNPIKLRDNLLSLIGGFLGIFGIFIASYALLDPEIAIYIIPSIGASAVLLFAAPHVPFSQPWNVFGGHLVSAGIGVACWQWIPDYTVAASASVGLAIGVMYFLRCTHPPGGATALAFVIGPEQLHELGYFYVVQPVLINTVTILLIAVAFNYLFKWRQYPAHLSSRRKASIYEASAYPSIKHEDFVYALSHIDTLVDIDEDDLLKIYTLATNRHVEQSRS